MQADLNHIPLIKLLPLAVTRGAIDSWGIEGPHLVFRVGADRLYVHPTVAGCFLADLMGNAALPSRIDRRILRVSLN